MRGANAAIQSFAVLEDSINAVNVIFGDASGAVIKFGEDAAKSAGLSEAAFNQAVTPIGALLQNFGFDAREAADASVILVQRAADLASVLGGDVTTALNAISSALRGQSEPLTAYGATISAARVEQFALAKGLAATKAEITDAITLQARYGLILEDTTKVAGDYAATADDLANAQRTAAAEFQNLATQIGEALAPAFESILVQAPAIIDFFASLNPQLAATAGNAAAAAGGLTVGVTSSVLALEEFADGFGAIADLGQAGIGFFEDLGDAIRFGDRDFSHFSDQIDQFNERRAEEFIRIAAFRLPRAIREGVAPINALGQAIAGLATREDDLRTLELGFERLRIQSGLTDQDTATLIQSLLEQAGALELNSNEILFLNLQLAETNDRLREFPVRQRSAAQALAEFDAPFDSITTRFTTFTSALEEIPAQMDSIAVRTREAAAAVGQSLNPFDEAPEDIGVSAREFFKNVTEEINREAEFQAGIVELIIRGHFDLARMIGDQGPAAQEALTGFLGDDLLATATEAALQSGTTETSQAIGDALLEAIQDVPAGPAREALVQLITDGIIDSPQIERGIVVGFASQAGRGISAFRQALIDEANQMDTTALASAVEEVVGGALDFSDFAAAQANTAADATTEGFIDGIEQSDITGRVQAVFDQINIVVDFFNEGAESRATFFAGLSAGQAAEERRLRDSIESTLNNAIQRRSPPKLFLDAGLESGEAFWQGFNQADLQLKTALPSITGGIATSTTVGGVGGVHVELTTINPIQMDQVSDTARMAQIAGSVAQTFNAVRPS